MDRTEVTVADLEPGQPYSLVNCCVIPRPIAWISTISADGVANIAPHSFFTVVSGNPPILAFSSIGLKDTVRNLREVPELVVHVSTEPMIEQVNRTGTNFPREVDEIAEVGLTPEPARLVRPPRIEESPIALECRIWDMVELPSSILVLAEVLLVAMDPAVVGPDGKPDARLVKPVTRLGRDEWGTLGEISSRPRIPWTEWQTGAR